MFRTLILLALLFAYQIPAWAQQFTVEELPAPPGGSSRAVAINARGDVAGSVYPVNGHTRAALWLVGRSLRWLGPDTDHDTRAVDINDRLQVPIQSSEPGAPGLLWDRGKTSALTASPLAINNAGTVLYQAPPQGIQWVALNDSGDRLGGTWDGPLLRRGSEMTLLVDTANLFLRVHSYTPVALNNRGQALLNRRDEILVLDAGAFLTEGGSLIPLPPGALARALNDDGAVVGERYDPQRGLYGLGAFLWDGGELVALETRLTNGAGVGLTEAVAINNAGQIVANGFKDGAPRGFRLTPIRVQASSVHSR